MTLIKQVNNPSLLLLMNKCT